MVPLTLHGAHGAFEVLCYLALCALDTQRSLNHSGGEKRKSPPAAAPAKVLSFKKSGPRQPATLVLMVSLAVTQGMHQQSTQCDLTYLSSLLKFHTHTEAHLLLFLPL